MARTKQARIASGFGHGSTAREVLDGLDLAGQNMIVTGGYSGIGIESVRALAAAGARVTVPARNRTKAEEALAEVHGDIEIADMDLADLSSVRRFAADYVATGRPLHALINNAGVMASPLTRLGPGWESQFAICHLGHSVLTTGLEKPLKQAANAGRTRVVALSSTAHIRGDVIWDDPHFNHRDYQKWDAYAQAKSANALFALGLDDRWQGEGVRAFSVHPGGIFTPLQRHLTDEEMVALGWKAADGSIPPQVQALFKSPEQGGATAVWAATNPRLDGMGGVYCEDCNIAEAATEASQRWEHARAWICDPARADRLWSMTEDMLAKA
jgi:NAD(P)-dependent dehydrogenase (short-subunit alcohol dehydrogenase family)